MPCHNYFIQTSIVKNNGTAHTKLNELGTIHIHIDQHRRQARERRQYIYAKSLEAQERQTWERKQHLKDALATGKSLPTELRKDAKQLGKDLAFDEAQPGVLFNLIQLVLGLSRLIGRTYDSY